MKPFRAIVASGPIALLIATVSVAAATPASARGCAQFNALKRVFPKATAVGLTSRTRIRREARRDPVLPGHCATWFATYRAKVGLLGVMSEAAHADTSLTLYRTHKQALRAFKPTSGPVKRLANGALVRTSNKINSGGMRRTVEVDSVYRNVFINSWSRNDVTPILAADQLRIHRRMHAGIRATS